MPSIAGIEAEVPLRNVLHRWRFIGIEAMYISKYICCFFNVHGVGHLIFITAPMGAHSNHQWIGFENHVFSGLC